MTAHPQSAPPVDAPRVYLAVDPQLTPTPEELQGAIRRTREHAAALLGGAAETFTVVVLS